ncbi:MAG TPA: outer membrane beta-barrel protein [Mucilaginibacter sp.]|nr:outer membrane beta-barrel protein [Mucilaginibacter sp.]
MKKNLLLTALLIVMTGSLAMAQSQSSAFSNGDNLLNVGIGLGSPFFGSGYSASLPINPTVSFEHGVTDAISVGGMISYASSKYSYTVPGLAYTLKENATFLGVRGSYHFNQLWQIPDNFDVYGGASLGYVIVNVSDNQGYATGTASGLGLGVFAGGKYYFQSNLAVYAELGYQSLSVLNAGITFKF